MSNEVIIDGCNVAKCYSISTDYKNRYVCESTSISMKYNHFCNENPNCYFKQLQRAKAELEQYKKSKQASYEAMQIEWNKAVNELRDVKAENEKLKAELDKYKRID